jgi:alkyl hydroperoxide reductase subunit AhpC
MGVSIDSRFCHDNWAKSLGGISYPLLQDFHPKGDIAKKCGVFLEDKGIIDRATVIIDKQGVVRYAASVTPAGERNPKELLAECQKINKNQSTWAWNFISTANAVSVRAC